MKNKFLTLIFSLLALPIAAKDMADLLFVIPNAVLPQIELNRLKDMVDMKKADQLAKTTNILGGYSELSDLTDDYARLEVSENMTLEFKQFIIPNKVDSDTIICAIRTTCAPLCDSDVSFFTSEWQAINDGIKFSKPSVANFLNPETVLNADKAALAIKSIDLPLVKISFSDDNAGKTFIASQQWMDVLPSHIKKDVESCFVSEVAVDFTFER